MEIHMVRKGIEDKLYSILAQNCDNLSEMEELHGKSIIEDMGLDSVTLMQIVTEVEEQFDVSLETSESLLDLLDDYDELVEFLLSESETADE